MRKKIVAGNWKMNLNLKEGYRLADSVMELIASLDNTNTGIILCTPFIHLKGVSDLLEKCMVETGAQNCSNESSGAFTGEVSAEMIKSTGADWVIIGHSERRSLFNENDDLLLQKTKCALDAGLKVIFCCGELLAQREAETHFETVRMQLIKGLLSLSPADFKNVVIAYEPVWAIGTGVTASPEQAQEMHNYIRELIKEVYGQNIADETTILYGGSCKATNASELFEKQDVDGGLIGGASLNEKEFLDIILALNKT